MMLTGANSRNVVHAVKDRLAQIQAELPAGVEIRSYYDRAEFIGRMLKTVFVNLAEGKAVCVMEASNKEAVAGWFKKMQMPCESITQVELEGDRGAIHAA